MNQYYEIVKKDIRAAQEEMIRLSIAGFKDRLALYQEALDAVLAETTPEERIIEPIDDVQPKAEVVKPKRRTKK